jgi:hypothetical protein
MVDQVISIGTGHSSSADWLARSTAAGVTMATNFATAAEVTDYVHGDSQAANITWSTHNGVPCMMHAIPAGSGENCGNWRRGLSDAFVNDGDGFGTQEFYVQMSVVFGPNWLTPSNGGGGRKIAIISGLRFDDPNSSSSALPFEIVPNNQGWRGVVHAYHQDGITFPTFMEQIGANLRAQPSVDWGASYDDQHRYAIWNTGGFNGMSPGCVRFVEGERMTILFRIKAASYDGSAGNEMDMFVAGETDSAYVQLFAARDFTLGSRSDPDYAGGFSALWMTCFDTGRINASYNSWMKVLEIIGSTQMIACPSPTVPVPTWATSWVNKTWKQPATNTPQSIWTTSPSGFDSSSMFAFGGPMAFDHRTKRLKLGFGGGHGDGDSNETQECLLAANSPAWQQIRGPGPVQPRSGSDYSGQYADGQPNPGHAFSHFVFVPSTGGYFCMSQPGLWSDGFNSGRFWELPRGATAWVARGYRPGTGATDPPDDTQTNGISEYDPYTGLIWTMCANGAAWTCDPQTYATVLKSNINPINFTMTGAIAPELRALLIIHPSTGAYRLYNLDTDAYTTPTIVGTRPTESAFGIFWHSPSRAWLAWGHSTGRELLYKLTPAASFTFTGTLTWSTVAADVANAITPPNISTYGNAKDRIHKRWALCPNFGGTRVDMAGLLLRTDGPLSTYQFPRGGV